MAHKHKYKIGTKVIVEDRNGEIHSLGYAINGTPKFMICDDKKDIDEKHPLGYQVILGRKIKIVKECDIKIP
jgi:hypothetical protein